MKIEDDGYPDCATKCDRCDQRAVVLMDGLYTCLACGATTDPKRATQGPYIPGQNRSGQSPDRQKNDE